MCSSVNVRGIDMSRCTDDSTDIAELGVVVKGTVRNGAVASIEQFWADVSHSDKRRREIAN